MLTHGIRKHQMLHKVLAEQTTRSVSFFVCVCMYKHTLCVVQSKVITSLLGAHFFILFFCLFYSFRDKFQGHG